MQKHVALFVLVLILIVSINLKMDTSVEEWHGYAEMTSPKDPEDRDPMSIQAAIWALEFTIEGSRDWPEEWNEKPVSGTEPKGEN